MCGEIRICTYGFNRVDNVTELREVVLCEHVLGGNDPQVKSRADEELRDSSLVFCCGFRCAFECIAEVLLCLHKVLVVECESANEIGVAHFVGHREALKADNIWYANRREESVRIYLGKKFGIAGRGASCEPTENHRLDQSRYICAQV